MAANLPCKAAGCSKTTSRSPPPIKETDRLTATHRGRSPRGDHADRLLRILDERHLPIPDRRGDRRIDTLRNLVERPAIRLLFLIPGFARRYA